jgi:hypothetical protein
MGKPDALSRWSDHGSGQGDSDNLTLLAPELFWIHALVGVRLEGDERNILSEVWHSLQDNVQEESVVKAARELRKDKGRGTIKIAEWSESNGLLIFHGKIYVPNDRVISSSSTTIRASSDMQAASRPSSSYPATTGGPRCPATSASMLSTVICAIGLKCNVNDLSVSSTLQRHRRHHGTRSASTS